MIRSPLPDVEIPNVSVYDFLFGGLTEADRDVVALVDGASGAETTYGALVAQVDAVAGALAARGIGVGDVVALHSPNVPAFAAVFHGILRSGATATTINALYTADDLANQLRDSGATLLFTVSPLLPAASGGAEKAGLDASRIVVLDGAEGYASLKDLIVEGKPAPAVEFDPATHLAVLPYSSGTTGLPKGVMLTHRNLVANVAQAEDALEVGTEDVVLAVLPFFHIYGMTVLLNLALRVRARLATMPKFDLPEFLRIIQDHKCTYAFIAPPIAVALAKHPLIDQYDLSSLKVVFSGAAPLDEGVAKAVEARLKCRVRQGYGMTELSPVSHLIPIASDDIPLGTVGITIPNCETLLIDPETGEEIGLPASGVSERGELLVRGPNVMTGYLNNDEATRATLREDGFLHTGDIATVSADGHIAIVDRLKELIKYKGYQVAPAELEALLLTHPDIADAAVIGVQNADGDEVPKAFIVRQGDSDLSPDGVMAFVAAKVSPHKKVRLVEVVEAIPKSASGKILRKDLRAAEKSA